MRRPVTGPAIRRFGLQLDELGIVEAVHLRLAGQELATRTGRGVFGMQRHQAGIRGIGQEGADLLNSRRDWFEPGTQLI